MARDWGQSDFRNPSERVSQRRPAFADVRRVPLENPFNNLYEGDTVVRSSGRRRSIHGQADPGKTRHWGASPGSRDDLRWDAIPGPWMMRNLAKAALDGLIEVFLHNDADSFGWSVEIDGVLDGFSSAISPQS